MQMTVASAADAPPNQVRSWKAINWQAAQNQVSRLQLRIAKAVEHNSSRTARSLWVLEPYDGKLSRTVLRGERGRKAPALPDQAHPDASLWPGPYLP